MKTPNLASISFGGYRLRALFVPRISDTAFVFLFSFVVLALAGAGIYAAVPQHAQELRERALRILLALPGEIQPEPKEKYTYLGLLILTPITVSLAALVQRRYLRNGRTPNIVFYCIVAGGVYLLWQNMFYRTFLPPLINSPIVVKTIIIFVAVFLFDYSTKRFVRITQAIETWGYVALALVSALVMSVWRVFDAHSVDGSPMYVSHLEAIIYSVVQISKGGTCLIDLLPQYGCYAEILSPIFGVLGLSTLKITIVLAVLQFLGFVALAWAIKRSIAQPFLAVCALIASVFVMDIVADWAVPYFQYMPIRFFFPALSLLLAGRWQRQETISMAVVMGVLAGLGVIWNLDTGAVVCVALGLFVMLSGCTQAGWTPIRIFWRAPLSLAYAGSAAAVLGGCYLLLSWKGGSWLPALRYVQFQETFYGFGFYMMPMPPPPDLWCLFAGGALLALCAAAVRVGKGPREDNLEFIAYVAILGAGLFSYYNGRSHPVVLALVTWPFILLLFALWDRAWRLQLATTRTGKLFAILVLSIFLAKIYSGFTAYAEIAYDKAETNWRRYRGDIPPKDFYSEVTFVKANTKPADHVVIIARNQGVLYAEAGLRSALPIGSWRETLLKADVEDQIDKIHRGQFDQFYLGYDLSRRPETPYDQKIFDDFANIKRDFVLVGWSPDGNLMRLIPRNRAAGLRNYFDDELKDDPVSGIGTNRDEKTGTALGRWEQPVNFPYTWPLAAGTTFSTHLRFAVAGPQPAATILSNRDALLHGLKIGFDDPLRARLHIGTAKGEIVSPFFPIAPDVEHDLILTVADGAVELTIDGTLVYHDPTVRMADSQAPIQLGRDVIAGPELKGRVIDFHVRGAVALQ